MRSRPHPVPAKKPRKPPAKPRVHLLTKFDASWKLRTLKNKLRVVHVPLPKGDARFHLALMVQTGSRFEPTDKAGLSHLLEHMMFRGSALHPTFSQLSEAFESLGGEWNAATGHEYTEYFYSGTSDKSDDAFKLLADFTLHPALKDLATEKKIVLRELEGELNENGVSTDVDYHVLTVVWPETTMASPIIGTAPTIESIELEDLKGWLRQFYVTERMVLIAVGGESKSIFSLADRYFSDTPAATSKHSLPALKNFTIPAFTGPKCLVLDNADNEYDVQIAFVCEGTNSGKTPAYDMLSRILGDGFSSRLVRRIREELGLVYDISVSFQQYSGGGTFNINASISESNIDMFFVEVFKCIRELRENGPFQDELTRHRQRAITDLILIPSDPGHAAFRLAWALLTGANPELDFWRDQLERLTSGELIKVACDVFQKKNLAVAVMGPKTGEITEKFSRTIASASI